MTSDAVLPNLFIAGASKSGSSTLFNHLSEHPDIVMTERDNPQFFSREANLQRPELYEQFIPDSERPRIGDYRYFGEGTANYLFSRDVPRRMMELLPEPPKVLFILRNPDDRAISHYWHKHKNFKDLRDLSTVFSLQPGSRNELIEIEKNRVNKAIENNEIQPGHLYDVHDDVIMNFRYLTNSFYKKHLTNFLDYIPEDNIFVCLTGELAESPTLLLERVENFLGIKEFVPETSQRQYNKTIVPKHGIFSEVIHRYVRPLASMVLPENFRPKKIVSWYHDLTYQEKPESPNWINERFSEFFQADKQFLAEQFDVNPELYWDLDEQVQRREKRT